ncbi:hypothetical protein [Gimesia aquarii]|uniref:Uncharacterized protein n=1 Tax=Gimesia aquarii TaxID=2527964 RepID=A0A517WTW6_9PLAN|nr:hypothetical protein [Gimesia aquarii]QDU08703.1 hypothetical protein V202x_20730 [Gimesia aquarii]
MNLFILCGAIVSFHCQDITEKQNYIRIEMVGQISKKNQLYVFKSNGLDWPLRVQSTKLKMLITQFEKMPVQVVVELKSSQHPHNKHKGHSSDSSNQKDNKTVQVPETWQCTLISLKKTSNQFDSKKNKVEVLGILQTGVVAIGGETTGVLIKANGIFWEVDPGSNIKLAKQMSLFNQKRVLVKGSLTSRQSLEKGTRWICQATSIVLFHKNKKSLPPNGGLDN